MRGRILKLALLLLLVASPCWAGDVIDGIVATVNGHPLLQSDWNDAIRFEALQQGPGANLASASSRRAAFDRIVEQELIREQMQGLYTPDPNAIEERETQIRSLYPEAKSPEGWNRVLASFGFTHADLDRLIADELQTLRFVDIRLRPTVKVDASEVEAYYRDQLVPEVRKTGAEPDPLSTVSSRIRDLLVEQKISQVFFDWIAGLKTQSRIEIFVTNGVQQADAGN